MCFSTYAGCPSGSIFTKKPNGNHWYVLPLQRVVSGPVAIRSVNTVVFVMCTVVRVMTPIDVVVMLLWHPAPDCVIAMLTSHHLLYASGVGDLEFIVLLVLLKTNWPWWSAWPRAISCTR